MIMMKKTAFLFLMLFASPCMALDCGDASFPDPSLVRGNIVRSMRYADQTGENYLVLTETNIARKKTGGTEDAALQSKMLHAYSFRKEGLQLSWKISDGVYDCPDITGIGAMHQPGSVEITDIDGDGTAEVWLAYELWCKGDVSPSRLKAIMHEGTQKYAIRGETFLHVDGMDLGGAGIPDPAFSRAPASFRQFAGKYWKRVSRGGKVR